MESDDAAPEPSASEPTFGARFLAEYKQRGGPLSAFSYAELQEIKRCDREGLVKALRAAQPMTSWAAIQRIRSIETPEELAAELWRQRQAAAASSAESVWLLLALFP